MLLVWLSMQKENKIRFGITMSPKLLSKIDEDRGLIPRSTFIEYNIAKHYQSKENILDICEQTLQMISERTPPNIPIPASKMKEAFSAQALRLIDDVKEEILKIKHSLLKEK